MTLRIRRGDRAPITVWDSSQQGLPDNLPQPDRLGLCRLFGQSRFGSASVVSIALQRLGVSPDGSGVVFEVSTDHCVGVCSNRLPVDRQGFFFVRSDGTGLRPLGPASREASFRIFESADIEFGFNVALSSPLSFSPNGRRIAFTDLGPGPGGEEAVQIVVLDLATDPPTRTQVTHLPAGPLPPGVSPLRGFVTGSPWFPDDETVSFVTYLDPDGANKKHGVLDFTADIRSGHLTPYLPSIATGGGRVLPRFGIIQLASSLFSLGVSGNPVNLFPTGLSSISEIFAGRGKHLLLQLTNFGRVDTYPIRLDTTRSRAFFWASANPSGENPEGACQVFSIGSLATGLRQLTHFSPRPASQAGDSVVPPLCGFAATAFGTVGLGLGTQDPVTKAVLFDSSCDPFGANPYGEQAFAMRPDGSGLRQLTDAVGYATNPDGSFHVELPGPFAYSAG